MVDEKEDGRRMEETKLVFVLFVLFTFLFLSSGNHRLFCLIIIIFGAEVVGGHGIDQSGVKNEAMKSR